MPLSSSGPPSRTTATTPASVLVNPVLYVISASPIRAASQDTDQGFGHMFNVGIVEQFDKRILGPCFRVSAGTPGGGGGDLRAEVLDDRADLAHQDGAFEPVQIERAAGEGSGVDGEVHGHRGG